MSIVYVTTDQTLINYLDPREVVLLEGVSVLSNAFVAVALSGANSSFTALGTVLSPGLGLVFGTAAHVASTSDAFVGATGTILSTGSDGPNDMAVLFSDSGSLTNHGTVAALGRDTGDHAVAAGVENRLTVANTGQISAVSGNGIQIDGVTTGGRGVSHQIDNSGRISGHYGVNVAENLLILTNTGDIVATHSAVHVSDAASLQVWNGGRISARFDAIAGDPQLALNDRVVNAETGQIVGSVSLFDGFDRFVNAGHVDGFVVMGDGNDTVSNSGLMTQSLAGGDGGDVVFNSGRIAGDVLLDNGADLFNGRGGAVEGTVQAGNGDDTVKLDETGALANGGAGHDLLLLWADNVTATGFEEVRLMGSADLVFEGSAGDDFVIGNDGANRLTGEDGNDTLRPGGGDDHVSGGAGDDDIVAGAGADRIFGDDGNDLLRGKEGDDLIEGGDGDDTLTGDLGRDTIRAGLGADALNPGGGADVLIFDSAAEMEGDVVRGFAGGEDVIDLSAIGDAAFAFIGTAAFTGTAMELRYRVAPNGHAIVQIDTDGDGLKDAQMTLLSTAQLEAGDFIL